MITREIAQQGINPLPLGDVAEFLDSRRKPVKQADRVPGEFPYFGANGQQGTINDFIFDEPLILLAEDGGFFDNPDRGIAYRIDGKTWVNNHAHVIRPKCQVDIAYLCRVLENYDVRPFINGSTRSKLTKTQASEIPIPLPPLAEQKRIAGILDQADALRRLRHRAVERLNTLGQAIFHEMFGENIKGTTTTLEEFADIQIGHPFKSKNYVDAGQGTKLCRGANILPNQIDWKQQADWPLDLTEDYSDFALKLDDTVIAMDRPWISSGFKAALIGKADLPSLLVQRVARIRAEKTNTKNFIYHLIKSRKAQAYFRPTETTVPHISPIEVKSFPLIEPSTAELDAFEKAIARQASATNIAECGVISSETLFASLQQRAFRGEL